MLTVLVPETLGFFADMPPEQAQKNAVIRLKGGLYSAKDFDPTKQVERPKRYAEPSPERAQQFSEKLDRLSSMRRQYHEGRYGKRSEPPPLALELDGTLPVIEPLDAYVQRVLGDDAIVVTPESESDAPSTRRRALKEAMREEEEEIQKQKTQRRSL